MMNPRTVLMAAAGWAVLLTQLATADGPGAKLLDVRKIWNEAPHSAFTDLLFNDGTWYCVFRDGSKHVSSDGVLRVLASKDGTEWNSAAAVTMPGVDLRDPKITVAPDGSLCLCGAGVWRDTKDTPLQSFVWYSTDGKNWGDAIPIGDPGVWIWRITWQEGKAYGIGYSISSERFIRLYESDDGRQFRTLVSNLVDDGYVNECGLIFLPDQTGVALIRRDNTPNEALLATAQPPYTSWTLKDLGVRVGGPHMLQLPDGRIIVSGRRYAGSAKTQLWWLDPQSAKLTEILTLPSGGDTSYPGLVYKDGVLWVSYYSSHDGKTEIYLAKVQLDAQ